MTDLEPLRQTLRQHQAALTARLRSPSGASTRNIRTLLAGWTAQVDGLLLQLWHRAGLTEPTGRRAATAQAPCLVAIGGYGRGQLFPYSDVDVLVLLPDAQPDTAPPPWDEAIARFVSACWDVGLEIGASVRSLSQCLDDAQADITMQTALLESRLLCGPPPLFAQLRQQHTVQLQPVHFLRTKLLEQAQRHADYQHTPYALEPNCKESPGGLRDLHLTLWLSRASELGTTWQALAANGLASAFEVQQIERNEALLCLVRARLHALAGRREDRLRFDLQPALAASFGYTATDPQGRRLASERLMRRYYWAAKAVTQLMEILRLGLQQHLQPPQQRPRLLNPRFADVGGLLDIATDNLYQRQPSAILETFVLYASTPGLRGLTVRTLRALYNARPLMDSRFRQHPDNRASFMRILQQPRGITRTLRLMDHTSVLGRYLWAFRRIVGQMQHDLFHVYTVDQHSLMAVRNMRRFFMAEHAHEYPACAQLAAGWDKPWLLYVAALFHDIGKGREGDHSILGAIEARRFCRHHAAHGVSAQDARLIAFLVAEHLSMSQVAQKQDLSDPAVIAAFAQRVGSQRYLDALYLLTVADIRATSPKVWNAWKAKLLADLYHATLHHLGPGGASAPDPGTTVHTRQRQALALLAEHGLPPQAHQALWQTLDLRYFLRHPSADIAWHAHTIWQAQQTAQPATPAGAQPPAELPSQPLVRARLSLAGAGLQVLVYAPDQPELFARICGYFDRTGFSILDARIHTARNGWALDTFQVILDDAPPLRAPTPGSQPLQPADAPPPLAAYIHPVEVALTQVLHDSAPLPEPAARHTSLRVRSFPMPTQVSVRADESGQRWLLELSATDRAGLLYTVARVFAQHQLGVELAKISTLGERVEDHFLLRPPQPHRHNARLLLEQALLAALG